MSMKLIFTFMNFQNVYWHGKAHSALCFEESKTFSSSCLVSCFGEGQRWRLEWAPMLALSLFASNFDLWESLLFVGRSHREECSISQIWSSIFVLIDWVYFSSSNFDLWESRSCLVLFVRRWQSSPSSAFGRQPSAMINELNHQWFRVILASNMNKSIKNFWW